MRGQAHLVSSTRALSEMDRLGWMKQLRIGKGSPSENGMKFINWPGIWSISELVCSFT